MKHTALLCITLVAVFALATAPASSFVRSTTSSSNGLGIAWNLSSPSPSNVSNGRITYNIHSDGSDNVAFTEVEKAINASFKAWEDIPTCAIAFTQGPTTTVRSTASDNTFPIYWVENSGDPDYASVSSALAVAFTFRFTTGPRTGEITDTNIVFNGVNNTWATDGSAGAFDISEVATHEIGHAIGLNHSPVGSSTMFPRTGNGVTKSRTVSPDDQIAVSNIYPSSGFSAASGTIQGKVVDGSANNIFGAHVVATDASGNIAASALSQSDGTYAIQGLNSGSYTVFAAPLDPNSGTTYFSNGNIGGATGFYGAINTDFQTSADQAANVTAGANSTVNFAVTRTAPTMQLKLIGGPSGFFSNSGKTVTQGQNNITIGVIGTALPNSGTPLSVSGPGITILGTAFGTSGSDIVIQVTISVAANAPPGGRNLIVTLPGGERSIVPGAIEVLRSGTTATVSAASFSANTLASESIATVFGVGLANSLAIANSVPLPTLLGGTTVQVTDSLGTPRLASLFFVSSGQINYIIPAGTANGVATVTITNTLAAATFTETIQIESVAPGLFTATSDGNGVPAAVVRRFANGTQEVFPSVLAAQGNGMPRPIDLGPSTDLVFLELYGTGLRSRSALSAVTIKIGSVTITLDAAKFEYAGASAFVGLDQVDVIIPRSLIGSGDVDVVMTVDGRTANIVRINIAN